MSFPEITTWANNIVLLLQIVGGAIIAVCIAVLALMLITSFGNEQRLAFVRMAAVTLIIGLFILVGAPRLATIIQSLVAFMNATPK
jgi:hypothetical protein